MKVLPRRPSPAMIIAILALVAALAGTAIAGSGGFVTKKKFNKFKKQAVTKQQFGTALTGLTYVNTTTNVPAQTFDVSVSASCPAGTHTTGGGIKLPNPGTSGDDNEFIQDSYPTTTGWAGHVANYDTNAATATTTAICASGSASGSPPSP
jgi:hypothetical protein